MEKLEEEQHEEIKDKLKKNSKNFKKKLKQWHNQEIKVVDYNRQKLDYVLHRPPPKRNA